MEEEKNIVPEEVVEESVETVEAEIVEDHPAQGAPVPTDVLNPDNPSVEGPSSGPFDGIFGGGTFEDYQPLFQKYNETIEQQGKNIDYLKSMIDNIIPQLNKCEHKVWALKVETIITRIAIIGLIVWMIVGK